MRIPRGVSVGVGILPRVLPSHLLSSLLGSRLLFQVVYVPAAEDCSCHGSMSDHRMFGCGQRFSTSVQVFLSGASHCIRMWDIEFVMLPFIHISLEECLPVVEVVVLETFIRDHPCIASSHKLGRSTCAGFVFTLMLRRGGGEVVVAACGVFRVAGCP
jgi:hypothetical protein